MHFAFYKLPLMTFVMLLFSSLAIRFKGKIIIQWIIVLLRYNNRPRFFIANKNDLYLREDNSKNVITNNVKKEKIALKKDKLTIQSQITLPDRIKLEHILPKANMRVLFNKKGEAYVRLSEVK